MEILIVYNPNAGRGKVRRAADRLAGALHRCAKNSSAPTVTLFNASSLEVMHDFWKENIGNPKRFEAVVLVGGDGTIGPNIDAMIKNNLDIPIYVYGRGTANDFSGYFKTNCGARRAARAILARQTTNVDTMKITNLNDNIILTPDANTDKTTFAINVAGGGAFTNGVTSYNKKSKRIFGRFAYLFKAFFSAFTLESQRIQVVVGDPCFGPILEKAFGYSKVQKAEVKTQNPSNTEISFFADSFIFYILNTKSVGSVKNAANLADPTDGLFDFVCVKHCNFFGKFSIAFSKLFNRLYKNKHVIYIQGKNFRVEPVGDQTIHNFTLTDIDGNPGTPYPLNVSVGPKICLIVRETPKSQQENNLPL